MLDSVLFYDIVFAKDLFIITQNKNAFIFMHLYTNALYHLSYFTDEITKLEEKHRVIKSDLMSALKLDQPSQKM